MINNNVRVVGLLMLAFTIVFPLFAGGAGETSHETELTEPTVGEIPAVSPVETIHDNWLGDSAEGSWIISELDGSWFVSDHMGNKVDLRAYDRVVITSAGAVEALYLINGEEAIAGIGTSRSGIWPEDHTQKLPSVGSLARPNFEQIVALEPDLVLLNGMNADLVGQLAQMGIPALIHGPDTISAILNNTLVLGLFSDRVDKSVDLLMEKVEALNEISNRLSASPLELKGAFIYSVGPIMAFDSDTLAGEILKRIGVENIADGVIGESPILSSEYILAENPDFIFGAMSITSAEDIMNADPVIERTTAGLHGNLAIIPSSLILRPTPRIVDELENLYNQILQMK
ncbi:ABC transporter substrate-binding protein [Salinispira pacifica]|uniref:Fe/B12 periplasmic-binding domain-containing protein n=1 Tax=Salinispira pacifica TaxID=1307761 RepID=V5WES7_9SPIO|nr:ABC transporter substrate-binding protein [Salinispira pacifica]AHC14034.1 hypothetical protein L21SP2_0605 [Salinispira pacifica]